MISCALRTCRQFFGEEAGAVLLETALVAPLMITLSAGVFEFSNAIHSRLLLEAGVTDAARYLGRCVHEPGDEAACGAAAQNLAVTGQVTDGGTARVAGWTTADVAIAYATTPVTLDPATGEQNYRSSSANVNVVQVSTTFDYTGSGLLNFLGFSPLALYVAHQERVIGW